MAKLPEPPLPSELSRIPPDPKALARGSTLWRIHLLGGRFPSEWNEMRRYGPTDTRFDPQLPPPAIHKRGVLYAAVELETCVAEGYQRERLIDRRRSAPWLVAFRLERPLRLLDLTGTWPTRAGASMAINSGSRARARKWSQAVYRAYPDIDGLWYASSMNANRRAVALYDRASGALPRAPLFHRALADPALARTLQKAAADFGYLVV